MDQFVLERPSLVRRLFSVQDYIMDARDAKGKRYIRMSGAKLPNDITSVQLIELDGDEDDDNNHYKYSESNINIPSHALPSYTANEDSAPPPEENKDDERNSTDDAEDEGEVNLC